MAANPDIVKVLAKLLDNTPSYAYYCRPLPRATVASIVEEIQMLRRALMASVPMAEQADAEAEHETAD